MTCHENNDVEDLSNTIHDKTTEKDSLESEVVRPTKNEQEKKTESEFPSINMPQGNGTLVNVDKSLEEAYCAAITKSLTQQNPKTRIAYTPLHGVAMELIQKNFIKDLILKNVVRNLRKLDSLKVTSTLLRFSFFVGS